jgi:hypothetical protein
MSIIRIQAAPPSHFFLAVPAGSAFIDEPYTFVAAHAFPVDQRQLDKRGWALHDTRAEAVLRTVSRHTTPLEEVVMGQLHTGIRIQEDDPFVIDEQRAREWLRRDPRCKSLLRRVVSGAAIGRYRAGAGKFLIHIPQGWTQSHPGAVKRPWQWLKHRHPLIARYMQPFEAQLKVRAGQDTLWWETVYDVFWQESGKKILFSVQFKRPVFFFDTGRGIGDETTNAIPSASLYLAGILNSRLMAFVIDHSVRHSARDKKIFTWDDLRNLPIYTPDFDLSEDPARHNRMELLVRRMLELRKNCLAADTNSEREALQNKIRGTDAKINALVYELYGLTPEEIAVVESVVPEKSPS